MTHTYGLSSQWSSINPCFSRCPASSLSLCPPQFYLTARWSYYVFDPRSTNCCNSCFPFFSSNRIFPPPMKFQIDPSISPFPDRWFELFFCEISLIRWGKFKSRLRISLHFVIRNDNNCNTDCNKYKNILVIKQLSKAINDILEEHILALRFHIGNHFSDQRIPNNLNLLGERKIILIIRPSARISRWKIRRKGELWENVERKKRWKARRTRRNYEGESRAVTPEL